MKLKAIFLLGLLLLLPMVLGTRTADLDTDISSSDQRKFDEILEPVMKIYNFVKYIASVIAAIFLLYAGICYMTSGSDPRKRDQAKNIGGYVIIGMIIIWAAPLIIGLLV